MNDWPLTCMYIAFGIMMLVGWPILAMPMLSPVKKIYGLLATFFVLIPASIGIFIWLAEPDLSILSAL